MDQRVDRFTARSLRLSVEGELVLPVRGCLCEGKEWIMAGKWQGIAGPKQDEDLKRNPGIGQSKGACASGEELKDAEGKNMVEGDVPNDPKPDESIDPDRLGRTNL